MPAQARGDPMRLFISGVQGVAGTDYQVYGPSSVVGPGDGGIGSAPVDLDGTELWAQVVTDWLCETIPLLPDGQTYTLVATTGGLTGTLDNLPEGAVAGLGRYGHETCRPLSTMGLKIHYDTSGPVQTVTATVVNGSPVPVSYTRVVARPYDHLQVNQPSTVTATVEVSSGATSGTVSFTAQQFAESGRPLGCASAHVALAAGAPATVTCVAGFSLEDSLSWPGEPVPTATFTPDDASTATGSLGYGVVGIHQGTTATVLSQNPAGELTATVTPAYTGPATPTGAVAFLVDDASVPKCSAQPLLTDRDGSATATCDPRFLPRGLHKIAASYAGDVNFNGSTFDNALFNVPPASSPAPDLTASPPPSRADLAPVAPPHAAVILPRMTRDHVKHRPASRPHTPQPRCKRLRHRRGAHVRRRCRRR